MHIWLGQIFYFKLKGSGARFDWGGTKGRCCLSVLRYVGGALELNAPVSLGLWFMCWIACLALDSWQEKARLIVSSGLLVDLTL